MNLVFCGLEYIDSIFPEETQAPNLKIMKLNLDPFPTRFRPESVGPVESGSGYKNYRPDGSGADPGLACVNGSESGPTWTRSRSDPLPSLSLSDAIGKVI